MNVLAVTISGPSGSGKTTMAAELSQFLASRGLNVSVKDERDTPMPWHKDGRCMDSLVARETRVDITTQSVRRDTFPEEDSDGYCESDWSDGVAAADVHRMTENDSQELE
jgi:molybdopterin-guanine dinucleotide biosynthesis protein